MMSHDATNPAQPPRRRRGFVVAAAVLVFQLICLGWSFTPDAMWLTRLGGNDEISGYHAGVARGQWYYAWFAQDWMAASSTTQPGSAGAIRINAGGMGVRHTFFPNSLRLVRVTMAWTLIPNVLLMLPGLLSMIIAWRRRRRAEIDRERGVCVGCSFDLIYSDGRCPECGQRIEAAAARMIQRLRAAEEARQLGAPTGC